MTIGPKESIRNLFQFEGTPAPIFVPLIGTFAAKLWQTPTRNLLSDATKLTNAIQKTCRLFQFDVVTTPFDLSLESEALGCKTHAPDNYGPLTIVSNPLGEGISIGQLEDMVLEQQGRVPVFVEVAGRLVSLLSKDRPIAAVTTGPITLANNLVGPQIETMLKGGSKEPLDVIEFAGRVTLKMVKKYCDLKPDIIIIAERQLMDMSRENYEKYKESLTTIWNLVRFYQIHPLLFFFSGKYHDDFRHVFELGADGAALGWISDPGPVKQMASEFKQCYASCIPSRIMDGKVEQLRQFATIWQEYLKGGSRDGFFITTDGEIPSTTPPNNVKELLSLIKSKM